ncbi:angiotensinogen [Triplophysa dalaica]|uniref:angiotensinogen n=1 Tax=Triplophysa dalaica TaxID=1582913 RepID=UPI0024DFFAFF|nr:angiotensinogen [Triplophysa dalaica]
MKMNKMYLTLLMISCLSMGMANRVYIHPFNLFSFDNISCEVIQKEDHQPLETVHPLTLQDSTEPDPRPTGTAEDLKNLTQRTAVLAELQNSLGFRMYHALSRSQKNTNTLLSPVNAFGTLVTLFLGASKKTAISYQQLLGLSRESDQPDCEYFMDGHTVLRTLQAISSHVDESRNEFKTVVWTFSNNDADLSKDFVRGTQDFSDQSFVRSVDFAQPKEAEVQVDNFIQKTSKSKAKKLFADVTAQTNLLFASSVNFKGNWKFASDPNATTEQEFWTDEESSVKVPLMKYHGVYMYFTDPHRKCFIVKLGLSKRTYLLLVLPHEGTNLQHIEKQLRSDIISKWDKHLKENHLVLYLPKFSLTAVTDLRSVLSDMAVEKYLMGSDASFSQLSSKGNFTVDQVFNNDVLEMTEEGSKFLQKDDLSRPVQTLTFNRPYFFALVEGNSNAILMLGKIVNPTI